MRYALFKDKRIEADKSIKSAICPCCKNPVISFCGNINVHHWRHKHKQSCDEFYEHISDWHLKWQNYFDESKREVIISKNGEIHRADILNSNGVVIEVQKSHISQENIKKRESFYEKMIWIFHSSLKKSSIIFQCKKPVFIDNGNGTLDLLYKEEIIKKKFNKKPSHIPFMDPLKLWPGYAAEFIINEKQNIYTVLPSLIEEKSIINYSKRFTIDVFLKHYNI